MIRPKYAFTLVEILSVVGIVALLAALLFPVLASTREKGRRTACLSNYHQIGLAIQQYAADFDDHTPPNGGSFAGIIQDCDPYTRTSVVFSCPDDFDRLQESRAGSYRMASLYQGLPLSCGWPDPYDLAVISCPVTTTLAYEAEQDYAQAPIQPTYRHNGGTQILLFDGHARWVKGVGPKDADD